MTATMPGQSGPRPTAPRENDERIVALVALLGTASAPRATDHDRDNTVIAENVRALQASGSTRLTTPADPHSLAATLRQVCRIQAELARSSDPRRCAAKTHRLVMLLTVDARRRVARVGLTLTARGAPVGPGRGEGPRHRPPAPR